MQLEALYRQVWDHPDDDEARRVLADALLAIGDPRGEFIQYQLQPERDVAHRAMRLMQQFGLSWLGKLRDKVIPTSYERGFLASCQVIAADDLDGHDEWATVHTIELDTEAHAFLAHPVMRSLCRVRGVASHAQLATLLRVDRPLAGNVETIGLELPSELVAHYLAPISALPRLATLELHRATLTLMRGGDGRLSMLDATDSDELTRLLAQLPADALTSIRVRAVPPHRRASVEQIARRQVRLVRLELPRSGP